MDILETNADIIQESINEMDNTISNLCKKLSPEKEMSPVERNFIEKYVLEKYLERSKLKPQSTALKNGTFVETKEKLVVNVDNYGCYCFGYYDDESKETLPLTEEKKKYCESLGFKIL